MDASVDAARDATRGGRTDATAQGGSASDAGDAGLCMAHPERCSICGGGDASTGVVIRRTWQFNPGGPYVHLPVAGYPCAAFAYDGPVRPAADDPGWTDAPDGNFIGFSETSSLQPSGYTDVQFRYFRSLVFVPANTSVASFQVVANGVDDSVHLILYNSRYPSGVSPEDIGPSELGAGACVGNLDFTTLDGGGATWDFKDYVVSGETNTVLVIHSDMSPPYSVLTSVDILVNGATVPTVACGGGPPVVDP